MEARIRPSLSASDFETELAKTLIRDGPTSTKEISRDPTIEEKIEGVWEFSPRPSGCGNTHQVRYLNDIHDEREVIEAWVQANPQVRKTTRKALLYAFATHGQDWQEAGRIVLQRNTRSRRGL